MDEIIINKLGMKTGKADLHQWQQVVKAQRNPTAEVTIAMVGKYTDLADAYKSINEALTHAGIHSHSKVKIKYVDAEEIDDKSVSVLSDVDGILVPGGFGQRGTEGKVLTAKYARENNIPYFGICLGMQVAVIDFARHVANLENANSSEFNPKTPHPVVGLIAEWQSGEGGVEKRHQDSDLGGTMRLGGFACNLHPKSKTRELYGQDEILERHRHRYEVNNQLLPQLEQAGLIIAGHSKDDLVEIIEMPNHPWFVACQFHPEFTSTPRDGHPLFIGFVKAARHHKEQTT